MANRGRKSSSSTTGKCCVWFLSENIITQRMFNCWFGGVGGLDSWDSGYEMGNGIVT